MKKLKMISVLFVIFAIMFTGCDSSGGGGGDPTGGNFSVHGTFKNGDSNSYFSANESKGRSIFSRAASDGDTSIPLVGTLDDGDITFKLKGSYDKDSGNYTLSAASSFIRYTIGGDGTKTTASIAVKDAATGTFKAPTVVSVVAVTSEKAKEKITSKKEAEIVESDIADTGWMGTWHSTEVIDGISFETKYIINEWGMNILFKDGNTWIDTGTMGFSYFDPLKDGKYDVVMDFNTVEWDEESFTVNGDGTGSGQIGESVTSYTWIEYPKYLEANGFTLFDPNVYPTIKNYGGNCLYYKEPIYLNENSDSRIFYPTEKTGTNTDVDGINIGEKLIQIVHRDNSEYASEPFGTVDKPIVIRSYNWAEIMGNEEYDYSTIGLDPTLETGTTYATLAEALDAAEAKFGATNFKASDYLSLDADYMDALTAMNGSKNGTVILEALKKNIPDEFGDVEIEKFSVFDGYSVGYYPGQQDWVDNGGYSDWVDENIVFPELEFKTVYQAMQLEYDGKNLHFKVHGAPGADLVGMDSPEFDKLIEADSLEDAKAFITNGVLIEESMFTLVR